MNRDIINARVTFRNSPIHVLEQFNIMDIQDAYKKFKDDSGLEECVIVQTCNRIEIFGRSKGHDLGSIKSTWGSIAGLDDDAFDENLKTAEGQDAIRHLLRLTSGLDSMVLGEEQILGQIKDAIASAKEAGASGRYLNTLFDKAIKSGTRIRRGSGIGRGSVSIGSVAVKLAEENIDRMKDRRVLLIGTGEVATLVAKSLRRRGYAFDVTSRTVARSENFCQSLGGEPVKFEDALVGFGAYDVLFVATTAPYSLVTHQRISDAMSSGKGGMMILDLSNPRTVDERVATIQGIKLMNLDQIAEMVERNMKARCDRAGIIENRIRDEAGLLEASMRRLDAEPLVGEVFRSIDCRRERELQKALQMLGETDRERIRIIDDLTKAVVESIMSTPMNNIRRASEQDRKGLMEAAGMLFDYEPSE